MVYVIWPVFPFVSLITTIIDPIYIPMKKINFFRRVCTVVSLMLLAATASRAQFITYPVPAEPVTRGFDSTLLTVQISFPSCTGVTVRLDLGATNNPGTIEYIPGSVLKISGTGTITESDISNLRSPVFLVGNTTLGQTLRFTIRRRAFCGSAASTKDNVVVTGTGCSFSEADANVNTYGLLSPAFTITPPAPLVNAIVGDTYNRSFSIVNGGNGCADTVGFWIKYPAASMQLNSLSFGGTPLVAKFSDGDSSYYELTGSLLGADNKLCNGESIALVENVTLLKCDVVTTYGVAGFDYSGARCQSRTSVSGMSMSNATPSITVRSASAALSSCFVSAPRSMVYIVKNNGGGSATSFVINTGTHFNNLPRGDTYGYIDTASLQISVNGAPAFHPDNSVYSGFVNTFNAAGVNSLSCNEGKIAHMQLTLPANVILGSGDSLVISYNLVYCPSTGSCTDIYQGYNQGTQVSYKNACGNTTYSTGNYVGSTSIAYNIPSITAFEFPAQVRAGDCYDVTLSSSTSPTPALSTRGYVEYSITMPPGVTFSTANLIGAVASPHAGYPRVVGNTVITRYSVNTSGNPVKFIFCTPPTLCTTETLDAVITVSPDSICEINDPASINSVKRCANSTIDFVCTGPCATGGTVPVYWKYRRKNFGQPDNDYNKMPDALGVVNPDVVYQDRYRPGDTLISEYRSYLVPQTSPASINSWNHINSSWTFSKHIWQPAGTATVTIKRGAVETVVPGVPINTVVYGREFNADFSQAPVALTSLAPFQPNDSVIVVAEFVLRDSLLSAANSSQHMTVVDDGTRGKQYADAPDIVLLRNSVHASVAANPAPANQFTCFVPLYNANTLHLFHFSLLYGNNLTGCNAARHEIRGFTRKLSGYTANYFPGEYRPEFIPDSLMLYFPAGMTVIPGSQSVSGIFNNTVPSPTAVTGASIAPYVTITGSAITGTEVSFNARAAFNDNPTWRIQSEGTTYIFGMDARGSCATPNAFSIAGRQVARTFQWPSPASEAVFDDSARTQTSSSYTVLNKPNVNLSSPDATSTPSSDTAVWTVLLQNSSAQAAPFNFIRLTPNGSFTDYVVKAGNTVLTPNGDGLYEVSGITAGLTTVLTISANTNSCALDSIKIESGWDCAAYPTGADLAAYGCWKTLWLKADPLPSQIQLTADRQPQVPSIELCASDTIIFKINSALANYADNPEFRVTVPVGLTISAADIEYPDGSGNWETVTAVDDNGVLVYNVEDHSLVTAAGLPGTISNPAAAGRAARLRLIYTTDCDFVSGTKVSVQQRAERPCGAPISSPLGYDAILRANPVNITGATSPGIVAFNLNLAPLEINCGTANITGSITPSGQSTTVTDTIVVTLPAGISFAGNFSSLEGMTVAAGYPVNETNGTQTLKLKVPAGVSSGNTINFSFDIAAAYVNLGCGQLTLSSQYERTFGALSCNGNVCPNAARSIQATSENTINVVKPVLNITGFQYVSGSLSEGGTATVVVTVDNSSSLPAPAGTYKVEFFCGTNTTPFATELFGPEVPAQGSASGNLTVTVPAAPYCGGSNVYTAVIRPLTAANDQQCLCNETSATTFEVVPVILQRFTASQQGCRMQLEWKAATEINLQQYEVEYSTDGRQFISLSPMPGRGDNSTYRFTHQPRSGRVYYRLRMTDRDGAVSFSNILAFNFTCTGKQSLVYPNPAFSNLNVNLAGYNNQVQGTLMNQLGQVVAGMRLQNGTNRFSVDQLPAGTYMLVISEADQAPEVHKVVIRR